MTFEQYFDWHKFDANDRPSTAAVNSLQRLRICFVGFLLLAAIVLGRVIQLEATWGEEFRSEAARPILRYQSIPGTRGQIISRNGTILAHDKKTLAVAIQYRYIERPLNKKWLNRKARAKLSWADRKKFPLVEDEKKAIRKQCAKSQRLLAELCGISFDKWARRGQRIQTKVERIAKNVNHRRRSQFEQRQAKNESAQKSEPLPKRVARQVIDILNGSIDELPPKDVVVAEELDYHVMVEDVSPQVVSKIQNNPDRYDGVKIIEQIRRSYPFGNLASHVIGHLGQPNKHELDLDRPNAYHADDKIGRNGLEKQYENLLRGRRGIATQKIDRSKRVLSSYRQREPGIGATLILTLDEMLQQTAENLLTDAMARRSLTKNNSESAGGAVVIMNVRSGAIITAASAPSFDPNLLVRGTQPTYVEKILVEKDHPLLNRVIQMAIPPGSVFKTVSAVTLLEAASLDPKESFFCQGYLEDPDKLRCKVYIHQGVGHGDIGLYDAIGQSCNVYFFHHAVNLGPNTLVDWAYRFGLDKPTGIDLPNEVSGNVPNPEKPDTIADRTWRTANTQAMIIGQGGLTTTPIQIARMMAAVANGGKLVQPHLLSKFRLAEYAKDQATLDNQPFIPKPRQIPGLKRSTLTIIRQGLEQTVSDPKGTAYGTVHIDSITVAGKTGTAQMGKGRSDHAWFAGYVPADQPEYVIVVVLEHSGNGAQAAGPVAKRLVQRMRQLGML